MIEILLPVYNGEKYLREQIESIISQDRNDWILKIRNDGSKDNSRTIINEYCRRFPDKIIEIDSPKGNAGLIRSINYLLDAKPYGKYVMLADQDDVWLPDKIKCSIEALKELETNNPDKPLLVCTDATCVDCNLNTIAESFFEAQKFPNDTFSSMNKMVALNVVQGCTIAMNREAVDSFYPIPTFLNVHDSYIALCVKQHGNLAYLHRPTLLYRQHSNNEVGAKAIGLNYYLGRIRFMFSTIDLIQKLKKHINTDLSITKILFYKLYYACRRII